MRGLRDKHRTGCIVGAIAFDIHAPSHGAIPMAPKRKFVAEPVLAIDEQARTRRCRLARGMNRTRPGRDSVTAFGDQDENLPPDGLALTVAHVFLGSDQDPRPASRQAAAAVARGEHRAASAASLEHSRYHDGHPPHRKIGSGCFTGRATRTNNRDPFGENVGTEPRLEAEKPPSAGRTAL